MVVLLESSVNKVDPVAGYWGASLLQNVGGVITQITTASTSPGLP